MIGRGWLEQHKNGACISLNPLIKEEIRRFLEVNSDMDDWLMGELL